MPTFAAIQEETGNMLALMEQEEELTPELKTRLQEYLAELRQQGADKVDAFCRFLVDQTGHIEACKTEARRLGEKAKKMQGRVDFLKEQYTNIMQEYGIKKVEGGAYTISLLSRDKVEAPDDVEELQALYRQNPVLVRYKVEITPNKDEIKKAIKAGVEVPGCRIVKSESLQVK